MSRKYQAGQFTDPIGVIMESRPNQGLVGYFSGTPTASVQGYEPGAMAIDVTNGIWYRNTGTLASATWTTAVSSPVDLSALTATAAEINRVAKNSTRVVAITPTASQTVSLDATTYGDKITYITPASVSFNIAIPAFDGTTGRRMIVFGQTLSSATVTITSTTSSAFFGSLTQNTDASVGYAAALTAYQVAASGSTIITLNGTTQGGRKGDWIQIDDVTTTFGLIRGCLNASGSETTPFS